MESVKTYLPDMVHTRIDDLVNAQTVDEETTAHMRELESRLEALQALVPQEASETALALVEDVRQLCSRIRRDFVEMAYHQGMLDGCRLREVLLESANSRTDR